jgi:hypothetical protein
MQQSYLIVVIGIFVVIVDRFLGRRNLIPFEQRGAIIAVIGVATVPTTARSDNVITLSSLSLIANK